MTNFSASLTKRTALLPQSYACSCYVSRPILALALCRNKLIYVHTTLRTLQISNISVTIAGCAWTWRLWRINPPITNICNKHTSKCYHEYPVHIGCMSWSKIIPVSNWSNIVYISPPPFSEKYWRNHNKLSLFTSYCTIPYPKVSHRRLSLHYNIFSFPNFWRIKGSRRQLSRYRN